ncbi:cell division control protein 42 [Mycena polygramma]|nr:cell division control protein 42 [Mycena polygramma]
MKALKLVVVGDDGVGKTCMLISHTKNIFPSEYIPTVFESWAVTVMIGEKAYQLGFWDTCDKDEYERLRPLSYPQTDVFLVCFEVTSHASFENVKTKWFPELHYHAPHIPRLIVVEKLAGEGQHPITAAQGERLAREVGAVKYVECSGLTQEEVKNVFDEAVFAAVQPRAVKPRRKCIVI